MHIDFVALENALKNKKYDEVKSLLNELITAKLTPEEQGAIFTDFAVTYMTVMNMVNSYYKKALEDAVAAAENMTEKISRSEDAEKLAKIREDLAR